MIIDGEVDLTTAKNKLLLNAKNLLKKANYTKLTDDEMQNSIGSNPHLGLNIEVNLNDYDFFEIYYRGK